MLITEYRIVLPISVEEYQVGQLYAVAEASKGETGGGEGVEVLVNEEYQNEDEKGQYTHKIYHLQSKVPSVVRTFAPKGSLELHEKAWNAYPDCKTVLTNTYFRDVFSIEVITKHLPDDGQEENVHNLEGNDLKIRKVVQIDIADTLDEPKDYKEEEDPAKFKSTKTGRGPLLPGWKKGVKSDTTTPHMCCYKLVKAEFNKLLLRGTVENLIQKFEKRLFTNFHRKLFCSIDSWYGMTMADIRELEAKTKAELDEMRTSGNLKGTVVD